MQEVHSVKMTQNCKELSKLVWAKVFHNQFPMGEVLVMGFLHKEYLGLNNKLMLLETMA